MRIEFYLGLIFIVMLIVLTLDSFFEMQVEIEKSKKEANKPYLFKDGEWSLK